MCHILHGKLHRYSRFMASIHRAETSSKYNKCFLNSVALYLQNDSQAKLWAWTKYFFSLAVILEFQKATFFLQ